MLVIKLAQTGKTNKKMFRLVISEKTKDPFGEVLEILGSYNPHSKELVAKGDKIKFWLSKGAQMTGTVNNLLVEKKVIEGQKSKASKAGKPSEKRLAQIKAKADKKAAKETASVETPAEAVTETPEAPAEAVAETVAEKA
jgi:small subunit ribosomal protein S16